MRDFLPNQLEIQIISLNQEHLEELNEELFFPLA